MKGGGYGSGWGNKRQHEWWKKAKNDFEEENKREKDVEEIRNLCVSLSRLVLRHDDQQAIDRTEKGFILFCQTNGMLSVIPDMVRCIEAWTKMKEENPTGLTLPRRAAMLKQLLDLWYILLEVVAETEESLSQAKNMLILNQAGQVPYLQYNRQTEQLEIKPDREPNGAQDGLGDYQGAPGPGTPADHHTPLPCSPEADVAAQGRYCPDDAGDRSQNPGSGSGLGTIGSPMSQWGLQSGGDEHAPRANGSLSVGEAGAADGRGFVRALLLGNSRNYCYSNAAFLALLWASVEHSGMMASESPMGPSLRMIVGWLCRRSGIVHLWQHLPWVSLHASWPQPHRQHDIIEYLQFLRPRLSTAVADCQWESRQELDGYIRRVDVGSTWPLWLPAPLDSLASPAESDTTISVQHLVDAWQQHAGAGSQALVQSPPLLLIQVNRFCQGSSRPTKSQTPVNPDLHLMLPVFQGALDQPNALEVVYERFRLSAALMHEGPAVTSGHYRTVLQDIGQQIITDDAVPARKLCEHTDGPHCRANYYAFVYRHCQSP